MISRQRWFPDLDPGATGQTCQQQTRFYVRTGYPASMAKRAQFPARAWLNRNGKPVPGAGISNLAAHRL